MKTNTSKVSFVQGVNYMLRSLAYMNNKRLVFWLGALLASLDLLIAYITPIVFQNIIKAIESNNYSEIMTTLVVLLSICAILTPMIIAGNYMKRIAVVEAEKNMSTILFDKVQKMSLQTIHKHETGDLIVRIVTDTKKAVAPLSGYTFTALMKFIIYTGISLAILLRTSLQYTIVGVIMSCFVVTSSLLLSPKARIFEQTAKRYASNIASMIMEAVTNAPIVRVFQMGTWLEKSFSHKCSDIAGMRIKYRTVSGITDGIAYLFGTCVQPVTFLMGIYLLIKNDMEIATIVYLSGITGIFAEGIRSASQFIQFIQAGFVSLDRFFRLLDSTQAENNIESIALDSKNALAVSISDLYFRYSDAVILKGINLQIPQKQKVALVGKSGCGKSTLLKLIARLYSPTSGKVQTILDNDLSSSEGKNLISYVSQNCDIFSGSIRENIAYGNLNASTEEISSAAGKAGCKEFIMNLSDGFDTLVDENGTNLSGGQKQRIAIARAYLKDSPILLLDEMTSAMDALIEEKIVSEMMKSTQNKTVLMVTHRMKVAQKMERIVVMENGTIIEDGSHEELIKHRGLYYQMCIEQGCSNV